ncbi:MAG: ABC transporter permease [Muribaculaceae bacterium]|nr:ABC transporter permease [Muribaculaceae bacterium]
MRQTGFRAIFMRSVLQLVRRPIYWVGMLVLPLFCVLFLTSEMESGLPVKAPAAIVDKDGSSLSRQLTRTLGGMQLIDLVETDNSYTQARHSMQEGKIYGFFLIPENFEADLLAGRSPSVTYYTNATYYVPAALLFKSFKSTALYSKAGIMLNVLESAGATADQVTPLLQPVSVQVRGIGNPWLNYAYYLCVSFLPGVVQLMILLVTCFSLGQEIKYGSSVQLMRMAGGSIYKAVAAKLLPQTIAWMILMMFLESWLFGWQHYPMHGSWFWFTVSELLFVLACQGLGLFFFAILPNLRLSLSVSALMGILTFSLAAFSFPVESMYGAVGIMSWLTPVRYNFLIYIDQALNGIDVYYSRYWYAAYIVFMLLPFTLMWRLRKVMMKPVYIP